MTTLTRMMARGTVALATAGRMLQTLQMRLTAGEIKDDLEHFEPYGYTSCPKPGAEGLALFLGGDRSHGVVVCVADRRFRLKELKPGEVALYTDEGDTFVFKRGRVVELDTMTLKVKAGSSVQFDTPLIKTTGRIESDGDQVAGGISQITHVHDGISRGDAQSNKPVAATP
ncbi:phage baseplate assembly protein [Pseudomonas guariconensis]|uniref:phage baseplate assembly protein V n=1 Tax=Pseudomonas guariconensis TaxID=1288410 RepID=UPI0018A9441E|nr:phage baseplate assembly protein V [Pseudomonas guariconensis]MBF8730452.1 phage baseplate assembly protein [Pseudomonas guariconensis]